jgi:hypothetical protein
MLPLIYGASSSGTGMQSYRRGAGRSEAHACSGVNLNLKRNCHARDRHRYV